MRTPEPVTAWALGLSAGCLAGRYGEPAVAGPAAVLAVVACVATGWAAERRRRGFGVLALVAVTLVGAAGSSTRGALLDSGPLVEHARTGGAFDVAATVATEPRVGDHGWWTIVRVSEVDGTHVRQRALLRGTGAPPALGTGWAGRATARPLEDDGFEGYLRSLHAAVALDPLTWRAERSANLLYRSTERVRSRVRDAFGAALPAPRAGLAVGLVTGDTRQLPPRDEEQLRATGLTHLVAVSGSNVAIVAAGAVLLCSMLGAGAGARRWTVAGVLIWFAVLTRFEPSVLRATVMALLLLAADARGVVSRPLRSLAVAVVMLLLVDPFLAASLGLVLSAAATAGVLVLAPLVRRRLTVLPDRAADLLGVTLGAQLAVGPVLLTVEGELPLSSIPANLVAVPASAIASMLAGTAALAAQVAPPVAGVLVRFAEPPLALILWVAEHWRGRFGVVAMARPAALAVALALGWWLIARPGSRSARLSVLVAAAGLVIVFLPAVGARAPVRTLTVTAIDVGQGDAILVETPAASVLVDAGGDERAAAWLRRHGRRSLDLVVVSHAHADHIGGLPAVLQQVRAAALWHRPVPFESDALDASIGLARAAATSIHEPVTGQDARVGDLHIRVLGPPPGRPFPASDSEPNDTSIVLRLSWGSRSALLTGDAELAAQSEMLRRGLDLRAGLLKVPHHGAGTTDPAFVAATRARVALISVGEDNRYGHPHPDLLDALRTHGMQVRRTDREGSVRVEVPPWDGDVAAREDRHASPVASGHAPRLPRDRLGRAARSAFTRGAARPAPRRGRRRGRRDRGRLRNRSPPGDAYGLAVRRAEGDRPAGRRGHGRGAQA